jgi:hypothetical protein
MPKSNRNGVSDTNPDAPEVQRADGEIVTVQTPDEPTVTRIDQERESDVPVIDEGAETPPPGRNAGHGKRDSTAPPKRARRE